jgi:L-asparaginase II
MLAYAKMRSWSLENYLDPAHPMQQEIFELFAEMASMSKDKLAIGIDGCSAPNWAAPLYNTALAYARLLDPRGLPAGQAKACKQVTDAMIAHPNLVGGPGRFDTALMEACGGRVLSKGGAEGFEGIALRAGALNPGSPAIGIAIKIADGDARTVVCQSVAMEVLRQLGALNDSELTALNDYGPRRVVKNWRGLEVGEAKPIFDLNT